jgi:DNA ligase D-like protein (predicted polymerase)/DNA ligase D-like protein (predicted 3'-phosphoesterase)
MPSSSTRARTPAATGEPPLSRYRQKRNFEATPEPAGPTRAAKAGPRRAKPLSFVIQKHWASRLHYDFRLELDGVLVSWAVPKGPSFDPGEKRMAVHVEDHPVTYGGFEGTIPKGNYGAGTVIVWDRGTWEPVGDAREGLAKGKLVFELHGQKLAGLWELVRIAKPGDRQDPWILFKKRDAWARPLDQYDVIAALPDSVVEKPLGLLEDREQPENDNAAAPTQATRMPHAPDLSLARKAALPAKLEATHPTPAATPPAGHDWITESWLGGQRLLARVARGKPQLLTPEGDDWTARLPDIAQALQARALGSAWLDGELVATDAQGLPDPAGLGAALKRPHHARLLYFVADAPFLDGRDLRRVPLWSRRALLREKLEAADAPLRFSQDFPAPPAQLLKAACQMKLPGISMKRADAPYVAGASADWLTVACAPRHESVTHGERVIDPTTGLTKRDLVRYYESIAPWMLPHLKNRPVSLVRAPQGITGELFFQKHPETRMPGLRELDPALWPGHHALLAVDTVDALVAAAQMNVVEFHPWNSTADAIDQPDRVIFDLDPGEGVSWAHLREAALLMHTMLRELGLDGWLKTSGGKGLHVVVPLEPELGFDAVKGFSQAVVIHMARTIPQRFVAKAGGAHRVGKIFIDYLRNGHGQTTACAFSARARPGLGVSMPVHWDELMSLKSASQWTITTAREYVSFQKDDPWADFWHAGQRLDAAMRTLGYKPRPA